MENINKNVEARQLLLNRIKEIEYGKEKYRTSGGHYTQQARIYWESEYLVVLKELKSLLSIIA